MGLEYVLLYVLSHTYHTWSVRSSSLHVLSLFLCDRRVGLSAAIVRTLGHLPQHRLPVQAQVV